MAKMHLAGRDYPLEQPNLRGIDWWRKTAPLVQDYLPVEASLFLQNEMRFQEEFADLGALLEIISRTGSCRPVSQ